MNSTRPSVTGINKRAVGRRLRCLIETQYPSISEFSRQAGVSVSTVYKIIIGVNVPSFRTLSRLCRHLGCSMDFLLGFSSPESDPAEGFETVMMNIQSFRSEWSRSKRLYIARAVLGKLPEKEERKLGFITDGNKDDLSE